MAALIHALITQSAARAPQALALLDQARQLDYATLAQRMHSCADALLELGLTRGERVGVYLDKRIETVVALFASSAAAGVMVPLNPLLKAPQVAYICADCNVRILITSVERLQLLLPVLAQCPDLHTVIVVGAAAGWPEVEGLKLLAWDDLPQPAAAAAQTVRGIDSDIAAILYTSGSTGKPKGVVLSHRNLLAGAASVAGYLHNVPQDRLLAALPLSFDYGLSQLTTAFQVGAAVVLINYLLPQDIIVAVEEHGITGLAAVPALWQQLVQRRWPAASRLRYLTNSGGAMPRATLDLLRQAQPQAEIFLMYGLTEAFRSTYLPPAELARRPDSIGRAIPNAEVLVLRADGSLCDVDEPGELVHRGALVAQGYWNDAAKTAERFKPLAQHPALPFAEMAVWSGDTVRRDADGFLYFIGRSDDMIKVSGYRVSPTEVEEVLQTMAGVIEVAVLGLPHPSLGATIVALVQSAADGLSAAAMIKECRQQLPAYMVPAEIRIQSTPLPRNPNGKIDRVALRQACAGAGLAPVPAATPAVAPTTFTNESTS